MINPSEICPDSLPFVSLDARKNLPSISCVYFAIDSLGQVQYIGMSSNLRQRWCDHHHQERLGCLPGVRVAWLVVRDPALLESVESALIQHFKPPLNGGFRSLRKYTEDGSAVLEGCPECQSRARKHGKTTSGSQRYFCLKCRKSFTPIGEVWGSLPKGEKALTNSEMAIASRRRRKQREKKSKTSRVKTGSFATEKPA